MRKRWTMWLGSALIAGGATASSFYFYTLDEQELEQRRAKAWLIRNMAKQPIRAPSLRRGDIIGELQIPRLKLSVVVFEGDDNNILRFGAGHIPGTALPAGRGNMGIAAHRDTYFGPLRFIRANDVIVFKTVAGRSRYIVTESRIVGPSTMEVLAAAPERDLTLVTCYPFFFLGKAPQRFIVHARKWDGQASD